MPVGRSQILAGKLSAAVMVGCVQVVIMFAVGHFAFGMGLGSAPIALAVLTFSVVLAAVGLGLTAAAFNLENVLTVPLIVAALIGGCMFPVDWLPPFIRTVGYAVPHTWAMGGYQDLLVRGRGPLEILPGVGVLLGFALMTVSAAAVVVGMGIMIASVVRSEGQAGALPDLVVISMAVVSGAMFPSIRIPGLMYVTPHYWAIQGFQDLMMRGLGVNAVLDEAGILLGMAAILFAVGVARFKFE